MKTLLTVIALSITATFAQAAPANTACPVSGKPVKESVTVTHAGKEIAFCCNGCKGKFEKDPAKYEGKIK